MTGATTRPVPCQVRSKTESPCPRLAVVEIRGVPFCEACAREQEAYFAIGELTQEAQRLRSKPLAEALNGIRRGRELTGGILASKRNRGTIEEPIQEPEAGRRPVGHGVRAFSSAE